MLSSLIKRSTAVSRFNIDRFIRYKFAKKAWQMLAMPFVLAHKATSISKAFISLFHEETGKQDSRYQ